VRIGLTVQIQSSLAKIIVDIQCDLRIKIKIRMKKNNLLIVQILIPDKTKIVINYLKKILVLIFHCPAFLKQKTKMSKNNN